MSKPKILIFAPREEPPETVNALEGMGCELVFGDRAWQLPRTTHEDAVMEAARDAVALMGTSMRHTPISRRIMQASQRLRIVAKYTVGVDDVDTEAATELGIMVCHAPTESNCFGVAETTIAFMLSLLKRVAERDADVRAGKWRTADNFAYYVGSRASDGFPGLGPGGKVISHVGRNPELPTRLEALQHEPEGALSARRPRIGRHRYHPVGHPADRVGHRPARKILTPKAPAPCGRFCFEP